MRSLFFRRRVPVHFQMGVADCGAACLSMVLAFHGRPISLRTCRSALGIGRDGSSLRRIASVAKGFGLSGEVAAVDARGLFRAPLPAIIPYPAGHFVVMESASTNHVKLVDPSRGRLQVGRAEFERRFSGPVLTFTLETAPTDASWLEEEVPHGRARVPFLAALVRIRGMRSLLGQILLASVAVQLLALTVPFFGKALIDGVVATGQTDLMGVLIAGCASLIAAHVGTTVVRTCAEMTVQKNVDSRVMAGLFCHLFSLPYRVFQERSLGDLLQRFESAILLRDLLANRTVGVLMDGLLILGFSTALVVLAPGFGALVLALSVIQLTLSMCGGGVLERLARQEMESGARVNGFLVEAVSGAALVKAAGAERRAFARWSKLFLSQQRTAVEKDRIVLALRSLINGVQMMTPPLLLAFGVRYVLAGEWTLGTLMAMTTLAQSLIVPVGSLAEFVRALPMFRAQLERLTDLADEPPEQREPGAPPPARLQGRLEMRRVCFQFPGSPSLALNDVSFAVEPGRTLAIVGSSGAGKSTLATLLLGLHRPSQGDTYIDGRALFSYDLQKLRGQIGVVLQEPFLFRGTLRQNIAFCDPAMSLTQVHEAARQAALHDEILAMPMGYDTMIAEGGGGLSGGQRQRLAIARALSQKPAILVLDEATSHLDTVTEEKVFTALNALPCTQVIIAHRLSTVKSADCILVLEHGRVAQMGRHEELLARPGLYAALFRAQVSD